MGLGSRLLYEDVEKTPDLRGGRPTPGGKRIKDMTLDEYNQGFANVNKIGSGA